MFRQAVAAAILAVASTAAHAASIDFTFDIAGSGVSIKPIDSMLSGCSGPGDCITAELASGFGTPGTVTVEEGAADAYTFDFLTFTGNGTGHYELYEISATLAFSDPSEATTTSGGSGGVVAVLNGYIGAGGLDWNDVPTVVTLSNGSEVWIDFEEGLQVLAGTSVTTTASIRVKSVADLAAVPLPAAGALLAGAVGVMGASRRRRS